ncbi:MAG TPA: carboxylesterase family protein, partial [Novosphingobium sp.]|nr:carboxylesterase family protein [Novosphingobium sp.]
MPNTVMRRLVAATMLMPMAAAIALPAAAAPAPLSVEGGAIAIPAPVGGVLVFHGLPYAAPPVGDRRWRAPAPLVPWQGVRAADSFSPDCMQPVNDGSPASRPKSEDCLYLNVWTTGLAGKRPVFVWIHGGGSRTGSGAQPTFDGASLARRGIVVVTINYRLGALGFLSTPELSGESGYGGSGNYGFMDDIAALQWVRRNIARFGGDPARVTIGGESSGAVTTGALMASPLARGLFRGVIGESGSVFRVRGGGSQGATSLASEEAKGTKLMQALGAADMAAMRALPPERIMEGTAKLSLAEFFNLPVVDGHVLPRSPWQVFARHQHNDVPLLVGWNSGEGSMELIYLGTLGTLPERMERYYGPLAAQARRWYPAPNDSDMPTLLRASGDYGFAYPEWRWALAAQRFGHAPVFVYQFDHAPPIPADQFGG